MAFIIGLVVVALFFLALHYFTEFDHMQKVYITIIVLSILSLIVMFDQYTKVQDQKMRDATLKFQQNKTLNCEGVEVNSTFYTLSVGTHTFIGKENTPNSGSMISASNCE